MRAMRARVSALVLLLSSSFAWARPPRPALTADAQALLAKGPAVLLADDDLLVPLAGAKAVKFLEPPPAHLSQAGEALVVVDGDLFRVRATALERVATAPGAQPACSTDCALVAGIEDHHAIKLTTKETSRVIPYRRDGRFELQDPWLTPDGSRVLVMVRDYTQPIDAFDFLIIDTKTGALVEEHLSKNFVPGAARKLVADGQVAIQMFTQREDEPGLVTLTESDVAVLDLKTKKLGAPPPSLRSLRTSSSGRWVLHAGEPAFRPDRACGGERTLVADGERTAAPLSEEETLVSALDFLPDEGGLLASVMSLKTCRSKLVAIPFGGDAKSWRTLGAQPRSNVFTAKLLRPLK